MFAACARYQMLYLPGRRGQHLVQTRARGMKERAGMIFDLRTFTRSGASGSPLLLLPRGAKRGAKRADRVTTAH